MTYFLKMKRNNKGAPLVEYVILMAFISFFALSAVLHLGDEVRDVFDDVADVLSETVPETEEPETVEIPLPPGTFSISIPSDGYDVVIDLDDAFPSGVPLRYSATGAYSVPYQERWPESENNNGAIAGISLGFSIYWLLNNGQKATIIGDSESQTGGGMATAHDAAVNRTIPTRAIGISIESYVSCGGGSTCFPGTFDFSISAPQ